MAARHYSHTRFEMFETCPFQFKSRYVDRIVGQPGAPLIEGSLTHASIEAYAKHLYTSQLETDVTALPDIARRVYFEEPVSPDMVTLDALLKTVESYARSHRLDWRTVVGVEEKWPVHLAPDIIFWVVLDLLQIEGTTASITDYKTDRKIRTQADVEADPQLKRYCWAVKQEYPQVEDFIVKLDFVRYGVEREAEFGVEVVEETDKRIRLQIDQMEREQNYIPRPGGGCAWCAYTHLCPAIKALQTNGGPVVITEAEQAQRVAQELALLEAQVRQRKDALSYWCNTAGKVESNGLAWGYWPSGGPKVTDARKFAAAMQAQNKDPWPYLSVNNRKIGKLSEDPEIAKLTAVDATTRFDSKKVKETDE